MIIVTGSKRSGTSMWMQVLQTAGVRIVGEAFSKRWDRTIRDANPHGFYESRFRRGIYYATNPDPQTGVFVRPDASKRLGVKVFVPGLVRTDLAYVDYVIGTVRRCSEYCASRERLYRIEHENLERLSGSPRRLPVRMPAHLEWWLDNFHLVRDAAVRGYPLQLVTYDRVLRDPATTVMEVLRWVGAPDPAAGATAVQGETRTQRAAHVPTVDHRHAGTFDALYEHLDTQQPLDIALLRRLNEVHADLDAELHAARAAVREDRRQHPKRRGAAAIDAALGADDLAELLHGEDG